MEQFFSDDARDDEAEGSASHRHANRDSLLLTAAFRIGERAPVQVRVRNLSAGGMMAEYAEPVSIGTSVSAELRGVGWVQGRIAWCAEGRVGVAFDHQIDPMAARKPVGKGAHTPSFVKPILPLR